MTRPYLTHVEMVESILASIDVCNAFAFGLACAERLWPVYEYCSQGRGWSRRQGLRNGLDSLWNWLEGTTEPPVGYAKLCESAVVEEPEDDAAIAASHVAASLFGLAIALENNAPAEITQVAQDNLRFLDSILYQRLELVVCRENDMIIDRYPLMQAEMGRQERDLSTLRGELTPELLAAIKSRSQAEPVIPTDELGQMIGI